MSRRSMCAFMPSQSRSLPSAIATLLSAIPFCDHTLRRRRAGERARASSPPGILRGGAGAFPGAPGRLDLVQRLLDDTDSLVDFLIAGRQRRAEPEAFVGRPVHPPLLSTPLAPPRPPPPF